MDPASKTGASSMVAGYREEHNGNNFEVFIIKLGQAALHFLWQNTYLKGKMKKITEVQSWKADTTRSSGTEPPGGHKC